LRVLKGGSAEVAPNKWAKFDIELDESDLQAIVVKNNLDYSKLSVGQKYSILTKQAEVLITHQMELEGLRGEKSSSDLILEFHKLLENMPKVEG
jgi:hypothetical protein